MRRAAAACLHMLAALVVVVDAVGDTLARGAVVGLLPVAGYGRAERDHDARVLAQPVQRQVERRVLARLNQQLVHHRPHHRACAANLHVTSGSLTNPRITMNCKIASKRGRVSISGDLLRQCLSRL